MKRRCPDCGYVHGSTDARAINRFSTKPTMYRANYEGAPQRLTRAKAEADMTRLGFAVPTVADREAVR